LLARTSDARFSDTSTTYAKALSEYRCEQYASALESARFVGSRQAGFLRAMCAWKLEDHPKALKIYHSAAARLPDQAAPQLIRLRNEAAELLGIDPNNGEPIKSQ
jgi:hypothetical protein